VRAAVVRLSSQGVRKAVASGPEVLRSISLVTGALAVGERPKAFRLSRKPQLNSGPRSA
jgi:hypothetical protein